MYNKSVAFIFTTTRGFWHQLGTQLVVNLHLNPGYQGVKVCLPGIRGSLCEDGIFVIHWVMNIVVG